MSSSMHKRLTQFLFLSYFLLFSTAHAHDMARTAEAAESSSSKSVFRCRSGTDYFQRTLNNMMNNPENKKPLAILMRKEKVHLQIKPQCIESALSQVSSGGSEFIRCNNSKTGYFTQQMDPCASAEYKKAVHMSFEWVTSCLRDYVAGSDDGDEQRAWVENYFKMLTKESGLHVNVVSQNGALGAAQLTTDYIEDFKQYTLPEVQEHLNRSQTPACKRLAKEYLTPDRISKLDSSCSHVDMDQGQPVLNMLIGFAHLKTFRDRVVKNTFQNSSFFKLTTDEKLKLEVKLVALSYNLGAGGLNIVVQRAMKTYKSQNSITDATNFIQRVHQQIPALTDYTVTNKKTNATIHPFSSSRVREILGFLSNIDSRYNKVLNDAGVRSCWAAW